MSAEGGVRLPRPISSGLLGLVRLGLWAWAWLFVLLIRLVRPVVLIRLQHVMSSRIGHFAANTELYLCEREAGINVPKRRYVDISFYVGRVSNRQLARMWERELRIWPAWLLERAYWANKRLPGGDVHEVGNNTQHDRDVHNLLERYPPHLSFTPEEEQQGQLGLRALGIPEGAEFVCLVARDPAYLQAIGHPVGEDDYHDYRNVTIDNYLLAAEALADDGCYVIRMGSVVSAPLQARHPRIIDYATGGQRSEFMDIYLCARCLFCLSCGTGLEAVPYVFRRPLAFVNLAPAGYFYTFANGAVGIFKHHRRLQDGRRLSLAEIFESGAGFSLRSSEYREQGIELVENTPEEIRDLALEMRTRVQGEWQPLDDDERLQRRFWELYPIDAKDSVHQRPLHGGIRARFGAAFLRQHPDWLN